MLLYPCHLESLLNYISFLTTVVLIAGPVRHFMELVLTGLSKNPHYNASEKKEIVTWYKEYFNNFTPEQLQATK